MKEKVILSWSGGKDSIMAFLELRKTENYEIEALLTTIDPDCDRICMHGIRSALLEQQAESIGITLEKVFAPKSFSNKEYETKMTEVLTKYQTCGVHLVAFGDIFLKDLRRFREDNLSKIGMKAIFPLWERDTNELSHTFIDTGFKAIVTCIDANFLNKEFIGRDYDDDFLSKLPSMVDPNGERGEFHSFVYDGPIFNKRILYTKGDITLKENRYYFCDLIPSERQTGT